MSIKNILVSTILMILGTYNVTQAEVIRGVDIPRVDTEKIVGKWFLLASLREEDEYVCATDTIERKSDDAFTSKTTYKFTAEAKLKDPQLPNESVETIMDVTLQDDSSVMIGKDNAGDDGAIVMVDVDYDSYMVLYGARLKEELSTGTNGFILVYGRQKTLPDGLIEKVKASNFYKEGRGADSELKIMNTASC